MIPVSRPDLNFGDELAVAAAIRSTFVAGGPAIAEFERAVAARCHRRYGVAVSSGTSALAIAVRALALRPASRVLLPSFTIVSALYAVIAAGCDPVFIDVDETTWNVDSSSVDVDVEAAIIVQTYASSPPMGELEQNFRRRGVAMIEDAAEGFGGDQHGRPFGSFGEMSVLSFYGNKLITTGEGGMVLTDDELLYSRLCALRNLFFDAERRFIHTELSGNHRMSGCQAALGLSQMKRIDLFLEYRRYLYSFYLDLLGDVAESVVFQSIPDGICSSCWVFPIVLKETVPIDASQFILAAQTLGIEMRSFFYPLDRQPFLDKKLSPTSEVSYQLFKRGLYLPFGNGISIAEVRMVAEAVKTLLYCKEDL